MSIFSRRRSRRLPTLTAAALAAACSSGSVPAAKQAADVTSRSQALDCDPGLGSFGPGSQTG
jgi:hypothetical protein